MDGHVAESSTARERPSEPEERLRKKTKQPRERNYGVNRELCCCFACESSALLLSIVGDDRADSNTSRTPRAATTAEARADQHRDDRRGRGEGDSQVRGETCHQAVRSCHTLHAGCCDDHQLGQLLHCQRRLLDLHAIP